MGQCQKGLGKGNPDVWEREVGIEARTRARARASYERVM